MRKLVFPRIGATAPVAKARLTPHLRRGTAYIQDGLPERTGPLAAPSSDGRPGPPAALSS